MAIYQAAPITGPVAQRREAARVRLGTNFSRITSEGLHFFFQGSRYVYENVRLEGWRELREAPFGRGRGFIHQDFLHEGRSIGPRGNHDGLGKHTVIAVNV